MPVNYICHICIPPYDRDNPEPLVRMFILRVLEQAEQLKSLCIVFPCLPKDVYGFTPEQCAFGYISSVMDYINSNQESEIREIKFVTIDKKASAIFDREADRRFGEKQKKSKFSFGKKKKNKQDHNEIELG